jgi:hypothetical protein
MNRLIRPLPFRHFGRQRHQRSAVPCTPRSLSEVRVLQSALPAFASASRNGAQHGEAAWYGAVSVGTHVSVRVYRSASRLILVGTADAVCQMTDRFIEAERTGMQQALFD